MSTSDGIRVDMREFDAFARRLDTSGGDIVAVAAWCKTIGIDFGAMVEFARRRDTVIEEMIVAGLDPFRAAPRRLASLTVDTFTDGLRRIKRCLYDGLRSRLLTWDGEAAGYVTAWGVRVKTPELLSDAMMNRLRALRAAPGGAMCRRPIHRPTSLANLRPEPNLISVMDGFVDPDPDFAAARSF